MDMVISSSFLKDKVQGSWKKKKTKSKGKYRLIELRFGHPDKGILGKHGWGHHGQHTRLDSWSSPAGQPASRCLFKAGLGYS